jgi:hypothetical protein
MQLYAAAFDSPVQLEDSVCCVLSGLTLFGVWVCILKTQKQTTTCCSTIQARMPPHGRQKGTENTDHNTEDCETVQAGLRPQVTPQGMYTRVWARGGLVNPVLGLVLVAVSLQPELGSAIERFLVTRGDPRREVGFVRLVLEQRRVEAREWSKGHTLRRPGGNVRG